MSWIKRRGQAASPNPSSAPPVQMYNPNEHSNVQSQWQHHDLRPHPNNWQNQPPANQASQQQFSHTNYSSQNTQQNYWQQPYQQLSENSYNQNQFNQQYSQHGQQQNSYQQPNIQQNHSYGYENTTNHLESTTQKTDSLNWAWDDADNSNVQTLTPNANPNPVANDDPWNWSVEDPNINLISSTQPITNQQADATNHQDVQTVENRQPVFHKVGKLAEKHLDNGASNSENVSLSQLPIISPKHSKSDHLTPQWSTESQVSQDSSEMLHTSESDKSYMLSRSSTVSESPVSGHDQNLDLASNKQELVKPHAEASANYYLQEQTSTQHENKEVLPNTNLTPPPPMKTQNLPTANGDSKNPFKKTSSQKLATKNFYSSSTQPFYPVASSPFNQAVNLETLPDNSEQPDSLLQLTPPVLQSTHQRKPSKSHQQWPENNEMAPINDRNQYLETGQLSNNDLDSSQNLEMSDSMPPPGFTRMVLGQMEQTDNLNNQDEPPPGLSRMVLGQTGVSEPPIGFQRMIPGESSSPEIPTGINQVRSATIGADTSSVVSSSSGPTVNRSQTIGADLSLPYSSNSLDNKTNHIRSASDSYNSGIRETNADGANNLDETLISNLAANDRRDSIEGELQEDISMVNLANSVRNLTVGETVTDSSIPERTTRKLSRQESTDSEIERENQIKSKERKDRRYGDRDKHDHYEKGRRRYSPSPDEYRDKKYEQRRRYKDKRFEDETDYYSDKDKTKRRDDRRVDDYDKKYSSLKRDKDKEKKRREYRSHREYSRDGHYYNRYEEDYEDQTRASSRSDSMHDSYRQDRDRYRERDRDRHRRHREPFNPYTQGYSYDPYQSYYQQYHYYENLRRTNPQAYAEWYRKYYQQSGAQEGYGNEERASVHSGRSSANGELAKDRYTRQSYYSQTSLNYYREPNPHSISGHYGLDETSRQFDQTESPKYLEETTAASQRLTPAKFSTAHVKASITSGHLVKIFPNYPLDGQNATVEISNLHELLSNDDEYKELAEFPGPLVKGVTHKKTVIEYCENKIRNPTCSRDVDIDSYILLWELLILLLRQNGMVVGTDIAELLMKDRKPSRRASIISNASSVISENETKTVPVSETQNSTTSILKEETVTNKFREFLIYGSGKEALEWAMKHGLWGHAFFLASKLDKRTYANVITRFANGIPINDPLQTLYQLLSGKVPVMCMADEKWGDWRPHLAMILSNTTSRPDVDHKSIATMGDTLCGRGNLYAAQFCYLMAHSGFGCYGNDDAKLVLLGANHNKSFLEFSINEAIHMTEVYEYACSLNDNTFVIPEFQPYKYVLATRLADRGLLEKALLYLEKVSLSIIENPALVQLSLISQVCQLADRLKYCDPVEESYDGDLSESRPDSSWLKDLKSIENDYNMGLIRQDIVDHSQSDPLEQDVTEASQPVYDQQLGQNQYVDQQQYQNQWSVNQQSLDYQQNQHSQVQDVYNPEQYSDQIQQPYWQNQSQWNEATTNNSQQPENLGQNDYWNNANVQPEEVEKIPDEDQPLPQISLPNQSKQQTDAEEDNLASPAGTKTNTPVKKKQQQGKSESGWFTKMFNVVAFKPKNQMHLPDDTNPSIVYDEKRKIWINKEEGDEGITKSKLLPPPKMSDLLPNVPQPLAANNLHSNYPNQNPLINTANINQLQMNQPNSLPNMPINNNNNQPIPDISNQRNQTPLQPASSTTPIDDLGLPIKSNQPNMFKLDRSRNMKKAYVDVLNPNSRTATNSSVAPSTNFGLTQSNGSQMNYFVPAPITDPNAPMDFLTPAPIQNLGDTMQQAGFQTQ